MAWLTDPILARGQAPFWLLVAITASGTLAMHILVPALPLVARDLHVSAAASQLAITFYLVGIAFGQLLYGTASDRFGRRPVLLVALIAYVGASIAAAAAPTLPILLLARVVQALGGCGGLVLGRAIVRDGAGPGEAASRMALLTMTQSLAPGIGPAAGGYLSIWFGWRSVLLALTGLGVLTLGATVLLMPETAASRGVRSGRMLTSYTRLLGAANFRGFMIGGAFSSTGIYAYLTASPFIFTTMLHRPAEEVGLYYLAIMAGIPFGSFLASRLVRLVPLTRLLRATNALSVVGATTLFGVTVSGHLSVVSVLAPMVVYAVGAGATSPVALASAIGTQPQMIGAASGLYGFTQMGFGALCTVVVGVLPGSPALSAACVLLAAALAGQFAFTRAARAEASRASSAAK